MYVEYTWCIFRMCRPICSSIHHGVHVFPIRELCLDYVVNVEYA